MRRAPFVVAATGAGLGLLLSFHTKPIQVAGVSGPAGAAPPGTAGATGGTGGPTGDTAPAGDTTPTGDTAPTSTAPGQTTPSTAARPPTTSAVRSATSQDIQYRYGDIQLKVTERGSSISHIQVVREGATDPRSAQINSQAVPMLQDQAMSAQSANIDGVSGATFTSAAYQEALQSALDQLG